MTDFVRANSSSAISSNNIPRRSKGCGREPRTYRWHRYRLPIRNVDDALQVYWISVCIQYQGKTTYQCDFITSIKPTEDNIVDLTSAAKVRCKIENETPNILKNKGYHMEHNFGHGHHGLTNVLLTMNLIAFCIHTVCDQSDRRWQQARARISTRVRFFHTMSVLNQYIYYASWEQLLHHISHPRHHRKPTRKSVLNRNRQPCFTSVLRLI